MNNMGLEKRAKGVGVEVVDLWCFDDWIDGNLISHDPLIYRERGWFYPSRKPLEAFFSKFPTSLEEFGSESGRPDPNSPFY
jgi:hypothetical protein